MVGYFFSFNLDPLLGLYHVQWIPESCAHNETKGPEKAVTQVSYD